jgi:5-methylcytosine-specific restriction endonuclease McrA
VTLSKADRATLFAKFGGRCAYCGAGLGARWHADHFEPLHRQPPLGGMRRAPDFPERDQVENFMPSCGPCNIDKATYSLEAWRQKLARGPDVMAANYATYRHSVRFGLVTVNAGAPVVFFFERQP